jgi:hypothetical protein
MNIRKGNWVRMIDGLEGRLGVVRRVRAGHYGKGFKLYGVRLTNGHYVDLGGARLTRVCAHCYYARDVHDKRTGKCLFGATRWK